jgi:hypothetical protein
MHAHTRNHRRHEAQLVVVLLVPLALQRELFPLQRRQIETADFLNIFFCARATEVGGIT